MTRWPISMFTFTRSLTGFVDVPRPGFSIWAAAAFSEGRLTTEPRPTEPASPPEAGPFYYNAPPVITGVGQMGLAPEGTASITLSTNPIPNLQLAGGSVSFGPFFQNHGAITNLTVNGSTLVGNNFVSGTLIFSAGGINGGLTIDPGGVLARCAGRQRDP